MGALRAIQDLCGSLNASTKSLFVTGFPLVQGPLIAQVPYSFPMIFNPKS